MQVKLGNTKPREWVPDPKSKTGEGVYRSFKPPDGKETVTTASLPDEWKLGEAFQTVVIANGIWERHGEGSPTWVSSDNEALAMILADHFGCKTKAWGK